MKRLTNADLQLNDHLYSIFAMGPDHNGWNSRGEQIKRFDELAKIFDYTASFPGNSSVLDVGSGTGDLFRYLKERGLGTYLGIDAHLPQVARAMRKYGDLFVISDFLAWEADENFDFSFCSGTLNAKLNSDNYEFLEAMVKKMWHLSDKGVAFNFLSSGTPLEPSEFGLTFTYSPEKVENIVNDIIGIDGRIIKSDTRIRDDSILYMVKR